MLATTQFKFEVAMPDKPKKELSFSGQGSITLRHMLLSITLFGLGPIVACTFINNRDTPALPEAVGVSLFFAAGFLAHAWRCYKARP